MRHFVRIIKRSSTFCKHKLLLNKLSRFTIGYVELELANWPRPDGLRLKSTSLYIRIGLGPFQQLVTTLTSNPVFPVIRACSSSTLIYTVL